MEVLIMNLDEIKQKLDQLDQNDLESIISFIKEKIISNKYIDILLDALESRYSNFVVEYILSEVVIILMACKNIVATNVIMHSIYI